MKQAQKTEHRQAVLLSVIVASVLLPLAGLVWWAHNAFIDTDRYVALISEAAGEPAVQASIASYLSDTIVSRVDTLAIIQNALPNRNDVLIQVLNDGLINFIKNQTLNVVESPQFVQLWSAVNRAAQQEITRLLLEQGAVLSLQSGSVVIDMTEVLNQVKDRLNARGLSSLASQLPTEANSYVLFGAPLLTKYQPYISFVESLYPWLMLLVIGLFALAIWLSANRYQAMKTAGIGILIATAVLAIIALLLRSQFVTLNLNQYYTADTAAAIFDTLTKPLWLLVFLFTMTGIAGIVVSRSYLDQPGK